MSEYQYYEFQAVDRPLGEADRQALRALSTRARITATSFSNHYQWGDFKGDPRRVMERWFDLHLYLANWGTRRLMIRLPKRLVDRSRLERFLRGVDMIDIRESGENIIIDIHDDADEPPAYADWDDGPNWLAALAPLRADLLSGDPRLFYLLWLTAAESGRLNDDETEPLRGIGPLTGALQAFADFFYIDPELVQAAAELPLHADGGALPAHAVRAAVAAIPETEKAALLCRLVDGDPHVAAEVRCRLREAATMAAGEAPAGRRTVANLRVRAAAIREERAVAEAERREAERQRRARAAEEARRVRLLAVRRRGAAAVWSEVETEIEKRNAGGYERAVGLLLDLQALAKEDDAVQAFSDRVRSLRDRHARKMRFIERLAKLDGP